MNEISDRVPAQRDVPLKNKRLERLMQRKLAPVDLAIVDKYAQYNQEFLSLVGLKNSMAAEKSSRSPSTWLRTSGEDLRSLIIFRSC